MLVGPFWFQLFLVSAKTPTGKDYSPLCLLTPIPAAGDVWGMEPIVFLHMTDLLYSCIMTLRWRLEPGNIPAPLEAGEEMEGDRIGFLKRPTKVSIRVPDIPG